MRLIIPANRRHEMSRIPRTESEREMERVFSRMQVAVDRVVTAGEGVTAPADAWASGLRDQFALTREAVMNAVAELSDAVDANRQKTIELRAELERMIAALRDADRGTAEVIRRSSAAVELERSGA